MTDPMKASWQLWRDRRGRLSYLRIGLLALLLLPFAKAVLEAGAIAHGARPLNELIHRAGFWALVFLGVTLAVTGSKAPSCWVSTRSPNRARTSASSIATADRMRAPDAAPATSATASHWAEASEEVGSSRKPRPPTGSPPR